MSITKTTLAAAAVAVLATGFGVAERIRAEAAEARLEALTLGQSALRAQLKRAESQVSQAEIRAVEADDDSARLLAAVESARRQASLPRPPAPAARATGRGNDPLTRNLHAMFPNGTVATVGEKTITVDEISRQLTPHLAKLQAEARDADEFSHRLNKLQNTAVKDAVERILLVKEFSTPKENEAPRQVAPALVERAIADSLREQFGNDAAKHAGFLESRGLSPDQYRQEVAEDIAYGYMRNQQRKLEGDPRQTKAK